MDKPTCTTCPFYDAWVKVTTWPPQAHQMAPIYAVEKTGGCRRHPHSTPHKEPNEWCGEHPAFRGGIVPGMGASVNPDSCET